jgi:hypothetical protein
VVGAAGFESWYIRREALPPRKIGEDRVDHSVNCRLRRQPAFVTDAENSTHRRSKVRSQSDVRASSNPYRGKFTGSSQKKVGKVKISMEDMSSRSPKTKIARWRKLGVDGRRAIEETTARTAYRL